MKTKVPAKRVPDALRKVIDFYRQERDGEEQFKDFAARIGAAAFEPLLSEFKETPELNRETIESYMDWDKTIKYKLERGEGECAV